MPATLFVVATPLGHLGDLTQRAIETLRQVPVVAAEDTRRIRGLLSHLEAHPPQILSFHAHSPERRQDVLLELLGEGKDVALVTDAGTPGVSDPGPTLIAAARSAGHIVVPIPGPSAVTVALSASGLPADRYLFLGFVPRKGRDRDQLLRQAAETPWTVVLFESPHRLGGLLTDLVPLAGADRVVVVARELTKLHEEIRSGTLGELAPYYDESPPRGEITVVLAGRGDIPAPVVDIVDAASRAAALLATGLTRKEVIQRLIAESGLPRNDAYRIVTALP